MAPQDVRVTLAALLLEPSVEVVPGRKTRQWHHEVAPSPADQTLDAALVVAFTRTAVAVLDQAMRQEPAEEAGAFACAIRQDARHQASVVVIEHRQRHPAEEGKSVNVAVDPSLCRCRWIGPNVTRVAMRQIEREEVGFLSDPADHHQRFAEISLSMARGVVQRDKHLPPAAQLIAHVILDDGVAAGELVQLGPLDRRRPPIPRRYRKAQHLLHALARNPKMTCRLAPTHPVPTGKTHLQIQFHGENAPALPAERKGKSGRVLLRQLRDYPAATVADFSTAVLKPPRPAFGPGLLGPRGNERRSQRHGSLETWSRFWECQRADGTQLLSVLSGPLWSVVWICVSSRWTMKKPGS